jgi:hypothetical protein
MEQDDFENESLLKDEDLSDAEEIPSHSTPFLKERCWVKLFLTIIFIFTILLVTILAIATQHRFSSTQASGNDAVTNGCGTSAKEAAVSGCIFDLMNYGWTPPTCYDHDLSNSSLSSGPWKWYYDKNATQPIEQHVIEKGQEMHI